MLIIILLLFAWVIYEIFKPKSTEFDHLKKNNGVDPINKICSKYHGGFRDVSAKYTPDIDFYIFEDKVRVIIHVYKKLIKHIDFKPDEILNVKYMNERELTESISLGRVVVFGWLGLAIKKKKEISREYVVLKCKYEKEEIDVVLGDDYSNYNQKCFETLNNYITEYKSKSVEV